MAKLLMFWWMVEIIVDLSMITCFVQENRALNKPTYQSSTYSYSDPLTYFTSDRAVDGITCTPDDMGWSHTDGSDLNPWWTVDLGGYFIISAVQIMNRDDSMPGNCINECTQRLKQFEILVGLDNNTITNNALCAYQHDVIPLNTTVHLECNTPLCGRFVTIYKNGTYLPEEEPLQMCEVNVFGYPSRKRQRTYKLSGAGEQRTGSYIATYPVGSRIECMIKCEQNAECSAANVVRQDGDGAGDGGFMCQLTTSNPSLMIASNTSDYYELADTTCY